MMVSKGVRQRVHAEVEDNCAKRRGQHNHHSAGRQDELNRGANQQQDTECRGHRRHFRPDARQCAG